ncbi:hypothetical protein B296_00041806 [Ensete ventricosum]|uniref:Uncharacterized protein n=1 Tax=Ensete ventricosum TaxID=4639 RepID=A0A426YEV1_ENSVE|nr:hypothetical protein B296_00041806 [Ensete ventricosum]
MHQEKPRHSDFIFRRKDPLASKRTDGLKDRPDREAPRARGREGLAHRFPRDLVRNTNDQGPREQGWACCHMLLAWVPHVEALDKLAQGVEMKGRFFFSKCIHFEEQTVVAHIIEPRRRTRLFPFFFPPSFGSLDPQSRPVSQVAATIVHGTRSHRWCHVLRFRYAKPPCPETSQHSCTALASVDAAPLPPREKEGKKKRKKEDEHMVLSRADVDDDRPDPIGVGDTARCQSISMARSVPRPTPGTMNPHL